VGLCGPLASLAMRKVVVGIEKFCMYPAHFGTGEGIEIFYVQSSVDYAINCLPRWGRSSWYPTDPNNWSAFNSTSTFCLFSLLFLYCIIFFIFLKITNIKVKKSCEIMFERF
jgi:hypothetical protein